ncbi:hypothetical protein D5086_006547 [Populus alba]|uniref:Uncharacterized protein n=1 Tax=Populus alba TaxID=43335 RepID=A0ACC4CM55_POPAL
MGWPAVSRVTDTKTLPFGVGALRELRTRFYLISSQEKTLAAFLFYSPPAILRHPVSPPLDDSATPYLHTPIVYRKRKSSTHSG